MKTLQARPDLPLVFHAGNVPVNQGYHVTEVKFANVTSMDCGKKVDSWDEIIIQLLDGAKGSVQGFMSTGTFNAIVSTSVTSLSENANANLYFEFSPGNGPLRKLKIQSIECDKQALSIFLTDEVAMCKPFHKWGLTGSTLTALERGWDTMMKSDCCSGITGCCR